MEKNVFCYNEKAFHALSMVNFYTIIALNFSQSDYKFNFNLQISDRLSKKLQLNAKVNFLISIEFKINVYQVSYLSFANTIYVNSIF